MKVTAIASLAIVLAAPVVVAFPDDARRDSKRQLGTKGQGSSVCVAATVGELSWTDYLDGEASIMCDGPNPLIGGFGCDGPWCEKARLYCGADSASYSGVSRMHTTEKFSEETEGPVECPEDYFVTAVSCEGLFCDDLTMQCAYQQGRKAGECTWTEWVSEEEPNDLVFEEGMYLRGMECMGDYCDNKRFIVCQALDCQG